MRGILLRAPGGEQVTLDQVARVEVTRGPEKIEREEGQRRIVVMSNVRGRDLGSFVAEVRAKLDQRDHAAAGLFHRVRRAVRKSGAGHAPLGADRSRRDCG